MIRLCRQNIFFYIFTIRNYHYPDAGVSCSVNVIQAVAKKNAAIFTYPQLLYCKIQPVRVGFKIHDIVATKGDIKKFRQIEFW